MYFTREPIVETVITSKEGYKLVLRNSRGGHEEYSVDAVEVVAFGQHCFFRSMEKSKSFLLPVSEYEILETREAKVLLKMPSHEKGIKIGGGREVTLRPIKEAKEEETPLEKETEEPIKDSHLPEAKHERKKERRRFRKRKEEGQLVEESVSPEVAPREEKISLIPPPATLISETISRYKDLPDYAGAFFAREHKEASKDQEEDKHMEEHFEEISLPEPLIEAVQEASQTHHEEDNTY